MIPIINDNKDRIKDFFADSIKGFALVWQIARSVMLINIGLYVLQPVLALLSLIVLKDLIDIVVAQGNITWQLCSGYLIQFALLQLGGVVLAQFSSYYQSAQQQLIADKIAGMVLQKAVELDLQYYENPGFYDELHMAQQQSLNKPTQLVNALQGMIQGIINIALLSAFLLLVHWSVILMVILLGIPLAVSKLVNSYRQFLQDKQYTSLQRKSFDLFHYLTTDAYAKEVRIFDFGQSFIKKFLSIRQTIFKGKIQLQKRFLVQSIIVQAFEILITTLIYATIIVSAVTGAITIGGLVIYFQVFQRLQAAITAFFQSAVSLFQNQLYIRQILGYLSAPIVVREPEVPQDFPPLVSGIRLTNINFTYPDTSTPVLTNINMNFQPGKITAIVGENGSGKSTLAKILCRLYNATSGQILLGDTSIADIEKSALRKNISAIFQDFGKYYLSVEENIRLSEEESDAQKLKDATEKSGLKEKLQTLPKGYKTILGRTYKNGAQLSGGQWQKVGLARGFYKNSKILILDEPTSSMDPNAEYLVFDNLRKDIGDKAVILITHRLYNLKIADSIYLMRDGKVIEHGSFEEMLAANGPFSEMYNKQAI